MSIPADVPIHRPSVGAMAVTTGSQMPAKITKPYVYRGTGEDTLTPEPFKEPAKPKSKRKSRRKPKPRVDYKRLRRLETQRRLAAQQARDREWQRQRFQKPAKPLPPLPLPEIGEDDPEPTTPSWVRKPKPAPGWKPMTGADLLDDLDDLLGDDE